MLSLRLKYKFRSSKIRTDSLFIQIPKCPWVEALIFLSIGFILSSLGLNAVAQAQSKSYPWIPPPLSIHVLYLHNGYFYKNTWPDFLSAEAVEKEFSRISKGKNSRFKFSVKDISKDKKFFQELKEESDRVGQKAFGPLSKGDRSLTEYDEKQPLLVLLVSRRKEISGRKETLLVLPFTMQPQSLLERDTFIRRVDLAMDNIRTELARRALHGKQKKDFKANIVRDFFSGMERNLKSKAQHIMQNKMQSNIQSSLEEFEFESLLTVNPFMGIPDHEGLPRPEQGCLCQVSQNQRWIRPIFSNPEELLQEGDLVFFRHKLGDDWFSRMNEGIWYADILGRDKRGNIYPVGNPDWELSDFVFEVFRPQKKNNFSPKNLIKSYQEIIKRSRHFPQLLSSLRGSGLIESLYAGDIGNISTDNSSQEKWGEDRLVSARTEQIVLAFVNSGLPITLHEENGHDLMKRGFYKIFPEVLKARRKLDLEYVSREEWIDRSITTLLKDDIALSGFLFPGQKADDFGKQAQTDSNLLDNLKGYLKVDPNGFALEDLEYQSHQIDSTVPIEIHDVSRFPSVSDQAVLLYRGLFETLLDPENPFEYLGTHVGEMGRYSSKFLDQKQSFYERFSVEDPYLLQRIRLQHPLHHTSMDSWSDDQVNPDAQESNQPLLNLFYADLSLGILVAAFEDGYLNLFDLKKNRPLQIDPFLWHKSIEEWHPADYLAQFRIESLAPGYEDKVELAEYLNEVGINYGVKASYTNKSGQEVVVEMVDPHKARREFEFYFDYSSKLPKPRFLIYQKIEIFELSRLNDPVGVFVRKDRSKMPKTAIDPESGYLAQVWWDTLRIYNARDGEFSGQKIFPKVIDEFEIGTAEDPNSPTRSISAYQNLWKPVPNQFSMPETDLAETFELGDIWRYQGFPFYLAIVKDKERGVLQLKFLDPYTANFYPLFYPGTEKIFANTDLVGVPALVLDEKAGIAFLFRSPYSVDVIDMDLYVQFLRGEYSPGDTGLWQRKLSNKLTQWDQTLLGSENNFTQQAEALWHLYARGAQRMGTLEQKWLTQKRNWESSRLSLKTPF